MHLSRVPETVQGEDRTPSFPTPNPWTHSKDELSVPKGTHFLQKQQIKSCGSFPKTTLSIIQVISGPQQPLLYNQQPGLSHSSFLQVTCQRRDGFHISTTARARSEPLQCRGQGLYKSQTPEDWVETHGFLGRETQAVGTQSEHRKQYLEKSK